MTGLDWAIVGFTVLLGFYGYLQGFIVGAMSLAGFALGAFLGTRLAPLLLTHGSRSPYAPLLGLIGALLVGAAVRQRHSRRSGHVCGCHCGCQGCAGSTGCSARR